MNKNDTKNKGGDAENAANDTVNNGNDTVNVGNDTLNKDTVFTLILGNPNITAICIAVRLGIGIATTKRCIKALKDNGIIKRVGSDKKGFGKY